MKIKSIALTDYKLFKGKKLFEFNDKLTIMEGKCGTGKTILFNAIKKSLKNKINGVKLKIIGSRKKLIKYSDIIFLSERQILIKNSCLSKREGIISRFLYILYKRRKTGLNLPLVTDFPFSMIDKPYRSEIIDMVLKQPNQVIIFCHPSELNEYKKIGRKRQQIISLKQRR